MKTDYASATREAYGVTAQTILDQLGRAAGDRDWHMDFLLMSVKFDLDNFFDIAPSLSIEFYATARAPPAALDSREDLIDNLRLGLVTGLSP